MKRTLLFVCIQFFLLASFAGETINFCKSWKFHLGDAGKGASSSSYNDSQWRILNIPHDWSIEGTYKQFGRNGKSFSIPAYSGRQEAALPVGSVFKLLKDMGCNAIRTSHNPFSPAFYNLCDNEVGRRVRRLLQHRLYDDRILLLFLVICH